jgi:hypothetical protein
MASLLFYILDVLVIVILVIVITNVKLKTAHRASLPPGPPGEPVLGHVRMIPQKHQAEFYHEVPGYHQRTLTIVTWCAGDVIYFNALGRSIIVLNSAEAAIDLLEKRSSIYSDRPPFVMFRDM